MLSASSREKPKRSATTHAHAIMTGARFTTVNLCLSAPSSKISWKSKLSPSSNVDAAAPSSGLGKYSFLSSRGDDDGPGPRAVSPYLRFFRGEDGAGDEGGDDEGGSGGGGEDDGSGARFVCRFFG